MSTERVGLSNGNYTLTLDKVISGSPIVKQVVCDISYIWNWPRNTGSATLLTVDGVKVDLPLFPEGIEGMLAFISDKPTEVKLPDGPTVVINRVVLELVGGNTQKAMMMLGEPGTEITTDEILATQNWELGGPATVERAGKVVEAIYSSGRPVGESGGQFTLTLDKVVSGTPIVKTAVCAFSYVWNWPRNTGSATLRTIDGIQVDMPLFPEGIEGMLAFMSDRSIEVKLPEGPTVVINRVMLELVGRDTKRAAMMLGEPGTEVTTDEILATPNWEQGGAATAERAGRVVGVVYASAQRGAESGGRFTLTLDKVLSGSPTVTKAVCVFTFVWNWASNRGMATLQTIDGQHIGVPLYPRGVFEGMLEFASELELPLKVRFPDGAIIFISGAIFGLVGGEPRAGLDVGERGQEFLVTQNWNVLLEETVKRASKVVTATYSS
ncbi:hypothetical protein FIBSPDRAFT_950233 [Athelia psychrophila]|uniref:Uncharacterized protein n=1 Tax=Athelia psychrophila TaxID=1759441 RepID=A0A166NZ35_9AGAM|nr:hypothetical protein FIBSPDRAFT_950233 [Fibularhizoctonia sp. CBS 109695]